MENEVFVKDHGENCLYISSASKKVQPESCLEYSVFDFDVHALPASVLFSVFTAATLPVVSGSDAEVH